MNRTYRILAWVLGILLTSILFVILMPSLMGIVLIVLMIFGITRFTISKQRHAADAFNSVLKSVVERGGDVTSVAVAFSKSGPLSGPAYEFARRLMMGQDPMEAASKSRIPLQLSTAVAMQTRAEDGSSLPASGITATGAPPLSDQAHSRVNLTSLNQVGSSVRTIQGRLLYLFIVAMMMLFIVSFLDLFIIPTIEALEEDIRYPESLVFQESSFSVHPARWTCLGMAGLAIIYFLLSRGQVFGWLFPDWFPSFPRAAQRKSDLLQGLANAVDAGWPIGRALAVAHAISIDRSQQHRLQRAMEWIEQGQSPAQAIQSAGWVQQRDVAWIENASASRLATLLRSIGDRNARDSSFNLAWAANLIFPIMILVLACVVTFYTEGFVTRVYALVTELAKL